MSFEQYGFPFQDNTHVIYPRMSVLEVLFMMGSVSESREKLSFTYIGPRRSTLVEFNEKSVKA